jgi:inward rectifier potassium channel
MNPSGRSEILRAEGYEIHVVGAPRAGLRDLYHWFLRVPWWAALLVIVGGYLLLNALFAAVYLAVGGVVNAAPGSYLDAFFFSVQTMGTIGYGSMYPATRLANAMVVAESVAGLVTTALATGLVFARFSQTRARVVFSSRIAIGPLDGVPALMIRVGNERRGRIVDAVFRLTMTRTTRTQEGVAIYRIVDLPLMRDRAPALSRSWMVVHRIAEGSPLLGDSPETLAAADAELTLAVAGTDETSLQAVHAQHTWMHHSVAWGARLADVLSETPDGNVLLDLRRFHDLTPTVPVAGFPYGAPGEVPHPPPGAG